MPEVDNGQREPAPADVTPPSLDGPDSFKNRNLNDLESPSDREATQRSRDLEKRKEQPTRRPTVNRSATSSAIHRSKRST